MNTVGESGHVLRGTSPCFLQNGTAISALSPDQEMMNNINIINKNNHHRSQQQY